MIPFSRISFHLMIRDECNGLWLFSIFIQIAKPLWTQLAILILRLRRRTFFRLTFLFFPIMEPLHD